MNAARRARQKANEQLSGAHGFWDHKREPDPEYPGKMKNVRCPACRPLPKTWDRDLAGKAV